jgi:DNA-binding transcriptional MerR regulator
MQESYTTKQFASLVNRDHRTLYKWHSDGKLIANKDFNGRNVYTPEHLAKVRTWDSQLSEDVTN